MARTSRAGTRSPALLWLRCRLCAGRGVLWVMRQVTLNDTEAIAIGAGILGTGGGGSTYLNRLRLDNELRRSGKSLPIIRADDVPDDALVCAVGGMGAPTVSNEKLQEGREIMRAVRAMEAHLRQPMHAIIIGEIGGGNALGPLVAALQLGLPAVDGDSMGRAFPELQMDTFMIYGVAPSPFALADTHGNIAIFPRIGSAKQAEDFARSLTIEMGGSAALVMPVMSGAELKRTIIRDTLSLAKRIGQAVLDCRARSMEPAATIAKLCHGRILFTGKIIDVERRTVQGFARGKLKISAFTPLGPPNELGRSLEIEFQNENLIAWLGDEVLCAVPDLITIVSLDDGEAIGTESLRYGLRVAVLGMPAPKELKTPAALAVVGPRAFGYDVDFQPLPGDLL
ncbi:MAG: DUF917 domain-containing protein [Chloroflexi bacterium]|nr:DUF917 domain-containing protein [Chloroflexota bacterium]MYI41885.1 DUF917 domain-containing protein [Chloroflexota bacterium]